MNKIKMLRDETVITGKGPLKLFAGEEYGEKDGITPVIVASLRGRGYAVEVVDKKKPSAKKTPVKKKSPEKAVVSDAGVKEK